MDASAIARAVAGGTLTATAAVEDALARITAHNDVLNAFTDVTAARARARAAAIDAAIARGERVGPLAGVPFAVKAMIDVAGIATTAGSSLFRDAPAATRDAEVVRRLEAADAICVGALNMDELGLGGTTENATFGATRNPHDLTRTAGGSSGGSAAALAAGLVPLTLGGDALGSIRLPASLCGVYGLRPTRGSVPDDGVLGSGSSLSTLGPLARTVDDMRAALAVMTGRVPVPHTRGAGLRLARVGGELAEQVSDDAREALALVADALHVERAVEWPDAARARSAAMLVNCCESASGKLELLRTRLRDFDPATRDRFLAHALLPAQWHLAAQRFRRWHAAAVQRLFDDVDVVMLPATPCVAPPLGAATIDIQGRALPTGPTLGWCTQPIAGTDCPALSVPVARAGKLPIGVQLVARPGNEAALFAIAATLENEGIVRACVAR